MTLNSLVGVYLSETISNAETEGLNIPLFIIQTSTAIAALDDQYIKFTDITSFKVAVVGKGLTATTSIIEDTLNEMGTNAFYTYSVKTDTSQGFSNIIKKSSHMLDIQNVVYIEETKSANSNTCTSKLSALITGANQASKDFCFRNIYVVPHGTVSDAVTNKAEGTSDEEAVITALDAVAGTANSGRASIVMPDYAGAIIGHCITCPYDEEPGFKPVSTSIGAFTYTFDKDQMIHLQNTGVLFLRNEVVQGGLQTRINLGVSLGFARGTADGLLVSRRVADELLRQIKWDADAFIKDKHSERNVTFLQEDVDTRIEKFAEDENIYQDATYLVVTEGSTLGTFNVVGEIKPVRSITTINVKATIN